MDTEAGPVSELKPLTGRRRTQTLKRSREIVTWIMWTVVSVTLAYFGSYLVMRTGGWIGGRGGFLELEAWVPFIGVGAGMLASASGRIGEKKKAWARWGVLILVSPLAGLLVFWSPHDVHMWESGGVKPLLVAVTAILSIGSITSGEWVARVHNRPRLLVAQLLTALGVFVLAWHLVGSTGAFGWFQLGHVLFWPLIFAAIAVRPAIHLIEQPGKPPWWPSARYYTGAVLLALGISYLVHVLSYLTFRLLV